MTKEDLTKIVDIQFKRSAQLIQQREMQDPLALKVISGEISEGDTIQITSGADGLIFSTMET